VKSVLASGGEFFVLLLSHALFCLSLRECKIFFSFFPLIGVTKSQFSCHALCWILEKCLSWIEILKKGFSVWTKRYFISVTLEFLWFSNLCNLQRNLASKDGRAMYSDSVGCLNCHFHYIYILQTVLTVTVQVVINTGHCIQRRVESNWLE
jgi:hypothetical protein